MAERKRHPLELTYEELNRTINRLESYLYSVGDNLPEELKRKVLEISDSLNIAIDQIPKQYHKTYYYYKKKAERNANNE